MNPIIRVENLTHTYGIDTPFCRSAVDSVSMEIYEGEFLGIIGHTGSGKSTLIQHFNGLLKPTSGSIYLRDRDIWADPKKIRDVRFQVGLVFQYPEYQLFEETVYQDIAFGPKNMGLDKDEIDRRVRQSARFVGLEPGVLEKSPFDLSGGQKRRVAIAGVIAMEPACIVLDESTAMLDPAGRREVLDTVKALNRDKGITVVLITHHMDEAAMADRVVVMDQGRVVMDGPPREILVRMEELREIGLDAPHTVELLHGLRQEGFDVPLDALGIQECAEAIVRALA